MEKFILVSFLIFFAVQPGCLGLKSTSPVNWQPLRDRNEVLGTFACGGAGVQAVTFMEQICIVTAQSLQNSVPDDVVPLGWTESGRWRITSRGLIELTTPMLGETHYFAFVRASGSEGLVLLKSADDSPTAEMSDRRFFRRQ